MYEFKMPFLGAEMDAGRLVEWKVKPGDRVRKQDIIAVVDTDKAAIEVECWQSGIVDKLIVEPGVKVPVGTTLALIREEASVPLGISVPSEVAVSMSAETKVDKIAAMQKVISNTMAKSKREIPHYYLSYSIDLSKSLKWLEEYNRVRPVTDRLICAAILLKAVALAVKDHPLFNGFYLKENYEKANQINVGLVISLRQGGLLAPAILNVDQLSLSDLMKNMTDLVTRARTGSLRSSEVEGPTITVTNLGDYGVDSVFGVIYPPQVCIIGFGKVNSQNNIVITLSADHRVSDGHRGSRFLTTINQYLQAPDKL